MPGCPPLAPSSSGLGHHPLKVATRVRIPLGLQNPLIYKGSRAESGPDATPRKVGARWWGSANPRILGVSGASGLPAARSRSHFVPVLLTRSHSPPRRTPLPDDGGSVSPQGRESDLGSRTPRFCEIDRRVSGRSLSMRRAVDRPVRSISPGDNRWRYQIALALRGTTMIALFRTTPCNARWAKRSADIGERPTFCRYSRAVIA